MKTLFNTLFLAAAAVALSAGSAIAQTPEIEVRDITAALISTPEYNFSRSPDQRSDPEEWLAVEVEFANPQDFIDELTFRVHIALAPMMTRQGNRYFTGEVTYVNIFEGRDRRGIVYVAPNSLKMVNDGRMISDGDIEEIGVEVLYKGTLVTQKNLKSDARGPWWQQMQPMPGHVLNKNQAIPFAPLYWSRYEQIKTPLN